MPLVINGNKVLVPGVESHCFLDDPTLAFTNKQDYTTRSLGVVPHIMTIHTRLGITKQTIVPGKGPLMNGKFSWDDYAARVMSEDEHASSWHISVGQDGSFTCHLDLATIRAYHAEQINDISVGMEIFQDAEGKIYQASLDTAVKIIDVITREFGIQRMIPKEDKISIRFARDTPGVKHSQQLAYIPGGLKGANYWGVMGHRNSTRNRAAGDPGYVIFQMLKDAGYEEFSIDSQEDINTWKERQKTLGISATGVPDLATRDALIKAGKPHGMWVSRPGD